MNNHEPFLLKRRDVLWGVGASAALLATTRTASAQTQDADSPQVEDIRKIADATIASEKGLVNLSALLENKKMTLEQRRINALGLFAAINEDVFNLVNSTALKLTGTERQYLWRHEFHALAATMEDSGISTQDPMPQPEPEKLELDKEAESCLVVCLYVIADVLGVSGKDFSEAVKQIFDEGIFYTVVYALGRAAKRGDWYTVTALAKQFFTLLFSEDILKRLRAVLGDDVFKKILKRAGRRFLPWVGPILLAGDVSIAIWNNWDLIRTCE